MASNKFNRCPTGRRCSPDLSSTVVSIDRRFSSQQDGGCRNKRLTRSERVAMNATISRLNERFALCLSEPRLEPSSIHATGTSVGGGIASSYSADSSGHEFGQMRIVPRYSNPKKKKDIRAKGIVMLSLGEIHGTLLKPGRT